MVNVNSLILNPNIQIEQAPKEVEHSGAWIYYNRKGDKIRDQIKDQVEKICLHCGCISEEQRLHASMFLPKLASKIRLLDCFSEAFKDETGPGRFVYGIENPREGFNQWLNDVKVQIRSFAEQYNAMGSNEQSLKVDKLKERLRFRGISEEKIDDIVNKYLTIFQKKRVPAENLKRVRIDNLIESAPKRIAHETITAQEPIKSTRIFDLISNATSDNQLKIAFYALNMKSSVTKINLGEKSNFVSFDHKSIRTVIHGNDTQHPFSLLHSSTDVVNSSKPECFFSIWDDQRERLGLISDCKFTILISPDQRSKIHDGLDRYSAGVWCSDNSENSRLALATRGFLTILKVPYTLTESSSEVIAKIKANNSSGYPAAIVINPINKDELFISSSGGMANINLVTQKAAQFNIKSSSTWSTHISCSGNKILYSLRHMQDYTTFLCDQGTRESIALNTKEEVRGLHLYEQQVAVTLHRKSVQFWDIRNTQKPISSIDFSTTTTCNALGANTRELLIGFQNEQVYGRLERGNAE